MAMAQEQYLGAIRPTLFIGLGGTGKEVLLRLRRKFYERIGKPGLPCTAYLWVDTDTRDVMAQGEKMNEIYQAVSFEPHEQIGLLEGSVGSDLAGMFRNRGQWSHIVENWLFPEVERFGTEITDGAGGVRAIGRLTFFYHFSDEINLKVRNALGSIGTQVKINETLKLFRDRRMGAPEFPPNPVPQVFIVSSLAGGTGCGTLLDMAFLLKSLSQSGGRAGQRASVPIERLVGVLFMPNVFYMSAHDEVSKRSYGNAYAALKELEFYTLRLNRQEDLSVDYVVEWNKDRVQQIQGPPFSVAYIEEMSNEAGIGLEPSNRAEIFSMVAESLLLDFMPGPFSRQKRSQYSNVVQYLSSVQGANIASGGVTLPQEFARRYASFGLSKIEIPLDTLKAAAASRLAFEVLGHINRDASDPHIKTNVLDDMARRQVNDRGLEDRFGTAWKDSIRNSLEAIFRGLAIKEGGHVDELEARLKQFEDQQIYWQGTDATKWGAAIDIIKKSTDTVTRNAQQALDDWINDTLEKDNRGLRSLLAEDGYLRYAIENLRELYAPRGEGQRAVYDEWAELAEKDADAYATKKRALLGDLREAIKSWGVAGLKVREWTIGEYLKRLRETEEQYALAVAARILYGETKRVAEAAGKFLSERRPAMDSFEKAAAAMQQAFDERFKEFINFGDQVLFIRFFDREQDWGSFYRLDADEFGQAKAVNPKAEYSRFIEQNFGGNATLSDLIELFRRKSEKEVRQKLSKFSEDRFWSDFEAHPREADVLEHPQMRRLWKETVRRMIRSAMPMIRREEHLGGDPLQVQRRAYLGISRKEGGIYEDFINDINSELAGHGYNEIDVQETDRPWEVYLYLVSYAFPLPALKIVTNDCHEAYFEFYQALRQALIQERRYHIPLHLSTAWEGKFEDLVLYGDTDAREVKEAREIILFGSLLKILSVRQAQNTVEYGYKLGAPYFRTNWLGPKREAIEALRENNQLRALLHRAISQREREMPKEQLETYYWIVQYLLFSNEYSVGSPERTLLDKRIKEIHDRLTADYKVAAKKLSFGNQAEEQNAETAKERAGGSVEWVGAVPLLKNLDLWTKPAE